MKKRFLFLFFIFYFTFNLLSINSEENYTINKGDVLEIYVWQEPELTKTVTVRPDGKISFPLVGDIKTESLTPDSLAEIIKQNLSKHIKEPQVTVIVKESNNVKSFIYIFGEVQKPGEYQLDDKLTLLKAISKAGGYKEETADLSSVFVITNDAQTKLKNKKEINLKNLLINGDLTQDVDIASGDYIYIPKIFKKIYVLGEVQKPGVYNLEDDASIIEAITYAGGFKQDEADMKRIMIVRKGTLENEISKINLENFIKVGDVNQNVEIKRGDVIYVPRQFNKIYVMGEVDKPGVYPIEDNMSVMEAITRAGGYKKSASLKSVMLIRKQKDSPEPIVKKIDLSSILKEEKLSQDEQILEGDVIYVPEKFISKVGTFIESFFKNINPVLDTYLKAYEVTRVQDKYNYYKRN